MDSSIRKFGGALFVELQLYSDPLGLILSGLRRRAAYFTSY